MCLVCLAHSWAQGTGVSRQEISDQDRNVFAPILEMSHVTYFGTSADTYLFCRSEHNDLSSIHGHLEANDTTLPHSLILEFDRRNIHTQQDEATFNQAS